MCPLHAPIFLASFAWTGVWFWVFVGVAVLVPLGVIKYGHRKVKSREEWLKEVVVPVMTSLVVALVGIGFAFESARRQHADTEADRQTSLMRDLMISQDRRETAQLLALHLNLNIHLHRYKRMIEAKNKPPAEDTKEDTKNDTKEKEDILFEEEAIFFFYSKHRAALVNLRSSKGNLVFRRVWMENIFEQLSIHVVETVLGGLSERDPKVSAQGESATYKLFGARPALSETNDESKRPEGYRPGGHLVLADFHRMMGDESPYSKDPDVMEIRAEFREFQRRLHNGDKRPAIVPFIDKAELISSILAMQGLAAYSYQNLLSAWYQLDEHEIPKYAKDLPECAPEPFLNLMWYDFERRPSPEYKGTPDDWKNGGRMEKWKEKRQDAWKLILRLRPEEAQAEDCPGA